MQGSKFPAADVWMPNWLFDVVCVSQRLAADIAERFDVELGEVRKPRSGPTGARQFLPAVTAESWHRPGELASAVRARHSEWEGERTGAICRICGRWKWLPVRENEAPIVGSSVRTGSDVIASPETFGDGLRSFRHLLFRRSLGEILVTASPRTWELIEVQIN